MLLSDLFANTVYHADHAGHHRAAVCAAFDARAALSRLATALLNEWPPDDVEAAKLDAWAAWLVLDCALTGDGV